LLGRGKCADEFEGGFALNARLAAARSQRRAVRSNSGEALFSRRGEFLRQPGSGWRTSNASGSRRPNTMRRAGACNAYPPRR